MSRRLGNPIEAAEGCAENLEYILNPYPCDDLVMESVRRAIVMKQSNVQNGAAPTFANIAALAVGANWTTFLTQPVLPAPATSDTILMTPQCFEVTKDQGESNTQPNGWNNYRAELPTTNSIFRMTFVGISQVDRMRLLTNIRDNRGSLSLWLITDNNELIYVEDTTVIPRGWNCINVDLKEGNLSGQKMTDILEFIVPYESSTNLRKVKIDTSVIDLLNFV